MNTETKINKPEAILKLMKNISYGYINNKNKRITNISDQDFEHDYRLQSPSELMASKIGVCWDQCELERFYFEKYLKLQFNIYYLEAKNQSQSTHTLLIYQTGGRFYWFENSWFKYRGIHEFDSLDFLFKKVSENQLDHANNECGDQTDEINWYLLEKPQFGISATDFMNHAKSKSIIFKFIKSK